MTVVITDYGAEYEYDVYRVTEDRWGHTEVTIDTTLDEVPWFVADKVEVEIQVPWDGRTEFTGKVRPASLDTRPEEPIWATVTLTSRNL